MLVLEWIDCLQLWQLHSNLLVQVGINMVIQISIEKNANTQKHALSIHYAFMLFIILVEITISLCI